MAEQLIDGTGSGFRARVNADNLLATLAVVINNAHHVNHVHEQAYSATVQQTPSGANTAFAYLKNLSTNDLSVECLRLRAAAAEIFEIWSVTGVAAGTDYTPVNANVGSGNLATCSMVVGNAVTGLTKDKLICRFHIEGAKTTVDYEPKAGILIGQSHAIAIYAVTGSILVDVGVAFDLHGALD